MSTDINETLGISQTPGQPGNTNQPGKYSSLKNIAGILTVFAWISGALLFIVGIVSATSITSRYGESSGLSILIILLYLYLGVFIVIALLAQAGTLKVLIDIEENTRKTGSK